MAVLFIPGAAECVCVYKGTAVWPTLGFLGLRALCDGPGAAEVFPVQLGTVNVITQKTVHR